MVRSRPTRTNFQVFGVENRIEASLDIGFEHLGFPAIGSWTLPVNLASQRVMEKSGFRYERDFTFAGLLHRFYWLAAGEWKWYDGGE